MYLSLCVFSSLHDQKSSRQNASQHGAEHTSFCESVPQGQLSRSLFLSRFFFFTRAKALSSFIPIYVITVFGQMCFRLAYSDCISGIHSVPKHFPHFSDSSWLPHWTPRVQATLRRRGHLGWATSRHTNGACSQPPSTLQQHLRASEVDSKVLAQHPATVAGSLLVGSLLSPLITRGPFLQFLDAP